MRLGPFIWDVCPVEELDGQLIAKCGSGPRVSMPLSRTGLFIEFSEAKDPSAWAEKFGMLFGTSEPETVSEWKQRIGNMKLAVHAFQSGDYTHGLRSTVEHFLRVGGVHLEFKPGTQELTLMPENLFSALWLQLAMAIHEKKQFRRCAWCDAPFHAKGKQIKAERVFCSNSCKQHDYRHRREHETPKTA
jgi:hypothetical protein